MILQASVSRRVLAPILALSTVILLPGWAVSQNREPTVQNVFRAAPRELTLRLSRARKAIENEEYNEAVMELGRLLAELDEPAGDRDPGSEEPQDYFVGPRSEQATHVSLKTEAQRLIGSMPAKGREWYELQYGAEARQQFEQAVEAGDPQLLTNVARRYFHTKAGYEASLLLGRYYLDQGQPLAAALCFRRLADSPAAASFEPELSVLTASCWLHSNSPDRAQQTLAALVRKLPNAKLKVGGKELELPRDETRAREMLESLLATRRGERGGPQTHWVLYRGDASRTARVAGDTPLATARWRLPTVNNPNDELLVEDLAKKFASQGVPALPSFQPLAVGQFILMRTSDGMLGVDMRTGKRVWPYPWDEMEGPQTSTSARGVMPGANNSARESELKQKLFEDAPYGQMSSDGEAIYFLHGLSFVSPGQAQMMAFRGPMARGNRNAPTSFNRLVALDIRREGKNLWVIGDSQGNGGDEPKLAGAFFLGPPLPLQGKLYALAEINAEVRLVALNPRTGKLDWQQQIAQLESRDILVDINRRLAGASPSYADGVLVCPTSAGAVVAVDLATRTLLWGFQYSTGSTNEKSNGPVFFPRQSSAMQPKQIGQHWADGTITIHDGKVLVTPIESDELFCLDLLTGQPAWPAQRRADMLYVATVHKGNAIIVGKNHLHSIRLTDGKAMWESPVEIPDQALPSGRGFHTGSSYYLPTTARLLVRFDLDTGRVLERVKTDLPLGNLICYRDEIISQSPAGLAVYPMVAPLRERVADLLQANPNDAWALGRQAELLTYDGKVVEALDLLRRGCQIHPEDADLRSLLVVNLMNSLRTDFPRYRSLAGELERLIDQPVEREQYLRLMASGLRQVGEGELAFDALLKLIDSESTRLPDATGGYEQVTSRHSVRRDRWVSAELATLYRESSADRRARIDAAVETRRREVLASDNLVALRQFVRHFGFHPLVLPARLEAARRLAQVESWVEAESLLAGLESSDDQALAASATAITARLLTQSRQTELAATYYTRLANRFGDVLSVEGRTGRELAAEAAEDASLRRAMSVASGGWPYGRVEARETDNAGLRNVSYGRAVLVPWRASLGAMPPGSTVLFDQNRNQSLIFRDGYGRELAVASLMRPDGTFAFSYYNASGIQHARALGQLVYVHTGSEVLAVNTLRAAGRNEEIVRWRAEVIHRLGENDQTTRPKIASRTFAWGGMKTTVTDSADRPIGPLGPCLANGVFVQKHRELLCLDPFTGDTLWSRSEFPQGCELFGDEEFLFVIPPEGKEVLVLDAIDGRDVGKRPIAEGEQRWATNGRRCLSWTESKDPNGPRRLRLYDVWSGKTLFEREFASSARGVTLNDQTLAVMQPDGQLIILSLTDGQPLVSVPVEPEPGLLSISLHQSEDAYCVITNRPPPTTPTADVVAGSALSQMVTGRVHSFDAKTGKARWQIGAAVEQIGWVVDQPSESPLLVFMRRRTNASNQSSLLCLDKRDGRWLFFKDDVPVQANFVEIVARPEQDKVVISMGARSFEFTFTNEPVAPQPPAQFGPSNNGLSNAEPPFGGLINSIFGAFGKGAAPKP